MKPLSRKFYARDAAEVAFDLLRKKLVRKINNKILSGLIVETEAYYGVNDPASRAYGGKKTRLNSPMFGLPGIILVYMVHANWLFNIVTGKEGDPQAVLIRSIEPLEGINMMAANRGFQSVPSDLRKLTSGPGRLTKALAIGKEFNGADILRPLLFITKGQKRKIKVTRSHRIGVKKDLPLKLRFYIAGNRFVSSNPC